jgi:V8-like Glu-specific endopeptidase
VAGLAVLVAGVTVGSSLPAHVTHAAPAADDASVSASPLAVSPQAAARADLFTRLYWTPDRMRAATPADVLTVAGPAPAARIQAPQGPAGSVAPALPTAGALAPAAATSATTPAVAVPALTPAAYTYPFPFTRFEVFTPYTSWPYDTEGKVFFHDSRGGGNFVCSGSVINSKNLSVVFTAGHCVVAGGSGATAAGANWYTNWMFCPAYKDGSCPLGIWTARRLASLNGWISGNDFQWDIGAAVMNVNAGGKPIVNVLGGQGLAWNWSPVQDFIDLGYPQAAPFNGNRLIECDAGYAVSDGNYGDPSPIGIGCDMTGGSSGGSWYIHWSGGGGQRNGHNDYKYGSQPLAVYSPYYGNGAVNLFNFAQGL